MGSFRSTGGTQIPKAENIWLVFLCVWHRHEFTGYFWLCPRCSHESVDRVEHMPGNKAQGGTNEHKTAAYLHLQMLNL